MEEETRKIKSFIAGIATPIIFSMFLGLGSQLLFLNMFKMSLYSSFSFGTLLGGILSVLIGMGLIIAINLHNDWKSWTLGFMISFVAPMIFGFLFFAACLIAYSSGGDSPGAMVTVLAICVIGTITFIGIMIAIFVKILKKDENPQTEL